jgi:cytochrome c5
MKTRWFVIASICCAFIFCTFVAAKEKQAKPQTAQPTNASENSPDESAQGEKLFRTHCGRCHNAPENISPREARAVVRQMRVRATLTDEDEKLILKFLAP